MLISKVSNMESNSRTPAFEVIVISYQQFNSSSSVYQIRRSKMGLALS